MSLPVVIQQPRLSFMAKLNLLTRQVYCFVLMAGVFSLQLAIAAVMLAAFAVPAIVIAGACVFPLSIMAWHSSRAIVSRMLAFVGRG